jgi:predicted Mrr-cat superfamily restriction endonuclease
VTENTTTLANPSAYVLRISLGSVNSVQTALDSDTIIIGWSKAAALLDEKLNWEQFRQALIDSYPDYKDNLRSAGNAAGNMWRFIRDMKRGDFVVVPYSSNFYVAQVEGDAYHLPEKVEEDTAFRRSVKWLNGKRPIPRDKALSALYSRMKIQGVSAYAHDLVDQIRSVLDEAESGAQTDFAQELAKRMAEIALEHMRKGLMNEWKFEKLVAVVLQSLGAATTITPRRQDKGDDIVATFKNIGVTVVAQVKYHINPDYKTGAEAVEQALSGMQKCNADLGWIVTCGRFSDEAKKKAEQATESIRLIEGDEFAKMVVACGMDQIHTGMSEGVARRAAQLRQSKSSSSIAGSQHP